MLDELRLRLGRVDGRHVVLLEYDGHVVGQSVQVVAAHDHVRHLLEVRRLTDHVVQQHVVV